MNNTIDLLTELSKVILPDVESATEQQIIDCLKHSQHYSEFAEQVERNILIENICKQLKIEVRR
jgi:hypothetical protein